MPTIISARLDKAWNDEYPRAVYRVLCGRLRENGAFGCGGELGTLIGPSPRDDDDVSWNLWFGPVMVRNHDGVWQLTSRAGGRLHHVTELASDPAAAPPVRERAQRLLRYGVHWLYFMTTSLHEGTVRGDTESDLEPLPRKPRVTRDLPRTGLPCEVRCPRCTGVNLVGSALLSQARERYAEEEEWYRQVWRP